MCQSAIKSGIIKLQESFRNAVCKHSISIWLMSIFSNFVIWMFFLLNLICAYNVFFQYKAFGRSYVAFVYILRKKWQA